MTNFDKITASHATMAQFLDGLEVPDAPWDKDFRKKFCQECSLENCDGPGGCPHQEKRDNPLWWLVLEAEESESTDTDRLQDLLKRATPRLPLRTSAQDRFCPACGAYISWDGLNDPMEQAPKFCRECGQAFDWSTERVTSEGINTN